MNNTDTHLRRDNKKKWLFALSICLVMSFALVSNKQAHALSNQGPDPNDFSSGSYGYIVTSALSPNVVIPTTHVNLYFTNNTGTKTVTITDGDMCTDLPRGTGGNYRDLWVDGTGGRNTPTNGQRVSQFFVQAGAYTSPSTYGAFSSSNTCRTNTKSFSFPGSRLVYQADINMYVASFEAKGLSTWPIVNQNEFFIRINGAGSIVGYDSGLAEDSFGLARRYPSSGYTNYNLRFGSACSVTTPKTVSGYIYDDDNGDPVVQPKPMSNELRSYRPDGTFAGNVPLTWTGQKRLVKLSGNRYEVFSGSQHTAKMSFTARPGYTYNWYWNGVYYVNILQYRLPFDSIYAVAKCPASVSSPQCNFDISTNPAIVDPDSTFKVTTAVDYDNYTDAQAVIAGGSKMKIQVTGPGISYSDANRPLTDPGTDNELVGKTASIGPSNASGTYTVTWSVVGPVGAGPSPPCSATFDIAFKPFFSVKGGDVSAGAKMGVGGVACATKQDDNASVVGWNQESPNYIGAGTQYAAFALNFLQDFATSQGTTVGAGKQPKGLSFSNTNNIDTGGIGQDTYGGDLMSEPCVPDYFASHPSVPTHTASVLPYTFNVGTDVAPANQSKSVYIVGNTEIDSPVTVPYGSHTIVYVKGDVQINKNITLGNAFAGGVVDIPSFTIIASGDILVNPGVDELDGWFIAQPDSGSDTNGIFYSCASNFAATPLDRALFSSCNKQLSVDGSVVARQIWLGRTFGSLYSNTRAERFFFVPEVWLGNPFGENVGAGGTNYDSIKSLPPAL